MHLVRILRRIHVGEMVGAVAEHGSRVAVGAFAERLCGLEQRRDAQAPAHEQIVGVRTDVERLAQRPEHIHMVAGRERGEFLGAITDDGEDEAHLVSVHLAHAERARHEMLRVVRI